MDDKFVLNFLNLDDPVSEEAAKEYRELAESLRWYFERRRHPDAENTAHEAIARALEKVRNGTILPTANFRALTFAIAWKVAQEGLRTRRREVVLESDPLVSSEADRIGVQLDLERALAELTSRERTLLLDYYTSDAADRVAIAKRLQRTPASIRVEVHRLVRLVQRRLRQHRPSGDVKLPEQPRTANLDVETEQALINLAASSDALSAALTALSIDINDYGEMLDRHRLWAKNFAR